MSDEYENDDNDEGEEFEHDTLFKASYPPGKPDSLSHGDSDDKNLKEDKNPKE